MRGFHRALHAWYQQHGRRDLPWRNTNDAYAIYLSEIMLQQTQVKTVLERFYGPFLRRFPTLQSLAKADMEDVLSAWQGLGYYSRALNLHETAKRSPKGLPISIEALNALPGIGRNTAHAVAAFAYRQPAAVMEANVKRVLCRIFALRTPNEKELWEHANSLLDRKNPFDYNQAMMDIGAMICTKRAPKCGECPANSICQGKVAPELYPEAKVKKAVPIRNKHIVLYSDDKGRVQATPRKTRFLQGLYHFTEQDAAPDRPAKYMGEIEQSYSHFTLHAKLWLKLDSHLRGNDLYSLAELEKLPMSMAEKKILQLLANQKAITQAA